MSWPFVGSPVRSGWPGWLSRLGELLTRKYGLEYERYWIWARNPLAVLILAMIVSTLCGLFLHPQGFVLAFGIGALLLVGVAWPWISIRGISGTLTFEKSRSREGEPVHARLALSNRCPWGAWGLAIHAGLGDAPDLGISEAPGWRTTERDWDFAPDHRGVYPDENSRIVSGFPFGLATSSRPLTITNSLVVWPRTFPVDPIPRVNGDDLAEGPAPQNRSGGSGDFLGVRPYRRGDSLRRVHWSRTARFGQMVVCELQSNAVPRVQIVLDTCPIDHVGSGANSSREWAIRIAASFVEGWIGQGAELELVLDGRAITARDGPVAGRRARLLDALARIGPEGSMGLSEMLEQLPCRRFASGLRVVIATDRAVARLDARRANGQTERFVVLNASTFDPSSEATLTESLPVRPWVLVDDPSRVAWLVRKAWKEVQSGR
jgi:uncharacterized protein (DUF58 family)